MDCGKRPDSRELSLGRHDRIAAIDRRQMASPLNKLVSGFRAATQRRKADSPGGPDADPAAPAGRLPPGAAARYGILVGGQSTEDELEAALNDLPAGYFDPAGQFDALEHELRQLPVNFDAEALEVVAEGRTAVLEVGAAAAPCM